MKRLIIMLVTLIGLTANAQTNDTTTNLLYQKEISQFFKTGDLTSVSGGKTQLGGTLTENVGYGLGFTQEYLSVGIVDYNTGISYVYKMVPFSVTYTNNDGVKITSINPDSDFEIEGCPKQ